MSNEQRIESFEARIRQLEKELAEQKQKLLTHELATGLILSKIVTFLELARPSTRESMMKIFEDAQSKLPESNARNDPHTADAYIRIIKILELAAIK
ncbi:hypothetical protein [Pseudescherichia sp.]|uniref:hypothetical protein n=1 Tax=Pseudescherichia sp. TaxID=2055881 RepID=UPI00289A144F|nr:hypothetical protein [Pseudescherichia sp.]